MFKKQLSIGVAVILAAMLPINVSARTPEFARTEEEWAHLRDDIIEYDEIEDLIHEYNSTVKNNQTEYYQFVQDYGRSNTSIAESYRDAAQKLYNLMSGENDAASLVSDLNIEMQAKQLLETADDTVEDSTVLWLSYEQIEKNLVITAQSYMINYYKSLISLDEAKNNIQRLQDQYEMICLQQAAGMATTMEVLTALETLESAKAGLLDLETGIENTYQSLCIMLGWDYEDTPILAGLPELDFEVIANANPESDKAQALEHNYTLRINTRKVEYAGSASTKETLERTIKNNERQISSSLSSAYQGLLSAMNNYEQAQADVLYEQQLYEQAAVKYQAGVITKQDYQNQEYSYNGKKFAEEKAYLDLFQAWENYQWIVKGLANAE